ncbi:unnamed protein product [Rhizophagus irregularis]|nr:unnamed protein product [Rhizophagus irregularis]
MFRGEQIYVKAGNFVYRRIPAFWIQLVSAPFTLDWYRRLSLWIGISAFHFGLVSAPFTLDWYRRPSLWIGIGDSAPFTLDWYRRNPFTSVRPFNFGSYRLRPLETCDIGCDLWKSVVSVVTFGNLWYRLRPLETCGIGCDLWKPVISISIGWNLLDRYRLRPLNRSIAFWSVTSWIAPGWNFEGLQVPGRFLNANLNSCLLESNQLE